MLFMRVKESKKLARRIRYYRNERGWTQWETAKQCKIPFKYYQEYEGKNPRDMRLSTMSRIAKAFGITLSELVDFDE